MFIVSPLLVDLSVDFNVSIAQAGQLVTIAAIPTLVLLVGPLSDIYGRRPILVGGAAILGISAVGAAVAPTYEVMAGTRLLAGIGGAAVAPTVFAAAADLFSYRERGRVYGYLTAALTLSRMLGIPMATLVAAHWGWRWSFAIVGVTTLLAAAALAVLYPPTAREPGPSLRSALARGYRLVLGTTSARGILGSSLAMSAGWMAFQTYLAAFLITRYGISTGDLAPILAIAGLGELIGSQIAGRLGERIGHKPIAVWTVLFAAVMVVLLTQTTTTIQMATLINFVMSVPMGMRFTSANTLISEVVPSARGTMNAMNATFFSVGLVAGSFGGGIIAEQAGYEALGVLSALGSGVSALLLRLFLVEDQPNPEGGPRVIPLPSEE